MADDDYTFGSPNYHKTKTSPVAPADDGDYVFGSQKYAKSKASAAPDAKPDTGWGNTLTYGIADAVPFAHDIGAAANAAETILPKWAQIADHSKEAPGDSFWDRYQKQKSGIENVAQSISRDHPYASTAIPLVTGAAALPVGGLVGGISRGIGRAVPSIAGLGSGALASGVVGSGLGGLYGAGTGDSADERLANVKRGAEFGAIAGSAAPYAGRAISGVGSAIAQHLGIGNAADKAAAAIQAARNPLTEMHPQDVARATNAGQPLVLGDVLGGDEVHRLAENAMVQSPKAEAIMRGPLQERFEDAGQRAKSFLQNITGTKLDPAEFIDDLHAQGQVANKANYKAAFSDPKAQSVWNPHLENIIQVPNVQKAIADASRVSQIEEVLERNQAIKAGLPAPKNPPIKNPFVKDANGLYTLPIDPQTGRPSVTPDLRFWDIVKRNLDSQHESALSPLGKATNDSRLIGGLRSALVDTLDRQVPSYQTAREGAASVFGEKDAYNAGLTFLGKKNALKTSQSYQDFDKLTPPQKEVFRQAVAASMAQNAENANFRSNSLRQFNDPATAAKLKTTLGPYANGIQKYLNDEARMDQLRGAIGNSRTAVRQADRLPLGEGFLGTIGHQFGYTGGFGAAGAIEAAREHGMDPKAIATGAAAGAASGWALKRGITHNRAIAEATARLLMEDDPHKLQNLARTLSQGPGAMNAVKGIGNATAPAARIGANVGAAQNQQNSPTPALAPAYAAGGAVKRKSHEELVSRLMTAAEKAKKATKEDTKGTLGVPDNVVAKALSIAQRAV